MEVLKLLEPEIQQRGIQINTDLQPSLPILSLDPVSYTHLDVYKRQEERSMAR